MTTAVIEQFFYLLNLYQLTMFSCIIVDDDLFAIKQLMEYISMTPQLSLFKTYLDPVIAVSEICLLDKKIDILFTDVEMPEMSGIKLVAETRNKVRSVILISGDFNYALDGYNIGAKNFINKPFNFEKFSAVIDNVISKILLEYPFLMVKLSGKNQAVKIYLGDIIAVEGASNYIKIHTPKKVFMPYSKMKLMEARLTGYDFKRVSKSAIISTKHIKRIEKYSLHLTNDLVFAVGESYRKDFDLYFYNLFKD